MIKKVVCVAALACFFFSTAAPRALHLSGNKHYSRVDAHGKTVHYPFPKDRPRFTSFADLRDIPGIGEVTELYLNDNDIPTIPAGAFSCCPMLRFLDLTRSNISTIEKGAFDGLSLLEELELSHNELTVLPSDFVDGCDALEEVRLRNNCLTTLPDGIFEGNRRMCGLDLSCNALQTLPESFLRQAPEFSILLLAGNPWLFAKDRMFTTAVFDAVSRCSSGAALVIRSYPINWRVDLPKESTWQEKGYPVLVMKKDYKTYTHDYSQGEHVFFWLEGRSPESELNVIINSLLHGGLTLRRWAHNRLVRLWHLRDRAKSLETWCEDEHLFFRGPFRLPTDASARDLTALKQKLVECECPVRISDDLMLALGYTVVSPMGSRRGSMSSMSSGGSSVPCSPAGPMRPMVSPTGSLAPSPFVLAGLLGSKEGLSPVPEVDSGEETPTVKPGKAAAAAAGRESASVVVAGGDD